MKQVRIFTKRNREAREEKNVGVRVQNIIFEYLKSGLISRVDALDLIENKERHGDIIRAHQK